jgi:hypothetical protein
MGFLGVLKEKCLSIEIDGQRVPLGPESIERALDNNQDLGKKIVDAVRAAYDRADD